MLLEHGRDSQNDSEKKRSTVHMSTSYPTYPTTYVII